MFAAFIAGRVNEAEKVPGFPDVVKVDGKFYGVMGGRTMTKGFSTPKEASDDLKRFR